MAKILVFGDSITWGAFDTEMGGWVERLKTHYFTMRPEVKYYVYNLGISSNDSLKLSEFLELDINKINEIEQDYYIFVFSIGSNDCRYIGSKENMFVSKEDFKKNILKIISIARTYSNKIFFTGFTSIDESKTKPWNESEYWEEEDLKDYQVILEDICNKENIWYINLHGLLLKEDLHDGIHPNAEGHRKIFERVKEELNKILEIN